ncbi:MAG: AAA family ATPase, partial [Smithellaceae bacterium]
MSNNQGIRVDKIELQDYRGQARTIELGGRSALIEGPNGAGKSSVLRAISLAYTGRLPGSSSELSTAGYAEDTGPSGAFKIEVSDTDRGRVVREFTGTQMRVRANFGSNPTSPRNTDHEQALTERCGRNMGLFMDANRIAAMPPEALRNMVLRMCAEFAPSSQWNADMIVDYLYGKVPGLEATGIVKEVHDRVHRGLVTFDPLAFMDAIQAALEKEATECRRLVREYNLTLNAKAPLDRPNPEDVLELQGEIRKREAVVSEAERAIGAMQERRKAMESAASKAKQEYEYSERYIQQARAAKDNAEATVTKYRTSIVQARAELDAMLKAKPVEPVAEPEAVVSGGAIDLFGQPVEAELANGLDAARAELAELDAEADRVGQVQQESNFAVMQIDGQLADKRIMQAKYASGTCPTCGQSVGGVAAELDAEIRALDEARQQAIVDREKANENQVAIQARCAPLRQKIKTIESESSAAQDKAKRADADYQNAVRNWESGVTSKQAEITSLALNLIHFEDMAKEAARQYAEVTAKVGHESPTPEPLTGLVIDPFFLQEIQGAESELSVMVADLDTYRKRHEELTGNIRVLDEFARRQHEAESEKQKVQNRQSLMTDAISLLPGLLSMIVDALVGPLVNAVNATMPPRVGRFAVRFNPSFSIGVERVSKAHPAVKESVTQFLPMTALSTAERCMFLVCVQKAIIDLQGATMPVILLDNVEVM